MGIDPIKALSWCEHGLSIFAFIVLAKYLLGWVSDISKKQKEILDKYAESANLDESIKKSLKEALELEKDGRKRCEEDSSEDIQRLAEQLCLSEYNLMDCAGTTEQLTRRLELLSQICDISREAMLEVIAPTWNRACESVEQGRQVFLKQHPGYESKYEHIFDKPDGLESKPKGLARLLVMHQRILFECMCKMMNGWREAVAIPLLTIDEICKDENITLQQIAQKMTSDRLIMKAMNRDGEAKQNACNGPSEAPPSSGPQA